MHPRFKPKDIITNGRKDIFIIKIVFQDSYEYGLVKYHCNAKNVLYRADVLAIDKGYQLYIIDSVNIWNTING